VDILLKGGVFTVRPSQRPAVMLGTFFIAWMTLGIHANAAA